MSKVECAHTDVGPKLTAFPEGVAHFKDCQGIRSLRATLAAVGIKLYEVGDRQRLGIKLEEGEVARRRFADAWPRGNPIILLERLLVAAHGNHDEEAFGGDWEAQHWCRNPACANINHLGAVPKKENAAGNSRNTKEDTEALRRWVIAEERRRTAERNAEHDARRAAMRWGS